MSEQIESILTMLKGIIPNLSQGEKSELLQELKKLLEEDSVQQNRGSCEQINSLNNIRFQNPGSLHFAPRQESGNTSKTVVEIYMRPAEAGRVQIKAKTGNPLAEHEFRSRFQELSRMCEDESREDGKIVTDCAPSTILEHIQEAFPPEYWNHEVDARGCSF